MIRASTGGCCHHRHLRARRRATDGVLAQTSCTSPSACGARSPFGVPPRHSPPAATPMALLQNRVSWDAAHARVLLSACLSQSSELLTVRSWCRTSGDPEPPGNGVTSPVRGNRLCSAFRCVSGRRPRRAKYISYIIFGDKSQRNSDIGRRAGKACAKWVMFSLMLDFGVADRSPAALRRSGALRHT
jgi:hypothetical protein